MRALELLKRVLLALFISAVSTSTPPGKQCGFRNKDNICYMNALFSAMYDVVPFRQIIYDNYQNSLIIYGMAVLFARKQLALLPEIDMHREIMPTVKLLIPEWEFGVFQDIDEFFRGIRNSFPIPVVQSIGYETAFTLSTPLGYVLTPRRAGESETLLMVKFPKRSNSHSLVDLIDQIMYEEEIRSIKVFRRDNPGYFNLIQASPLEQERQIDAIYRPIPTRYADIVPVFLARRTIDSGSNSRDFRTDRVSVPETITFPLEDGTRSGEYNLISFAVYHPGHYLTYAKNFPSRQWHCFNDESVKVPSIDEITQELEKNAVMIFYVRKGITRQAIIPPEVEQCAVVASIAQHSQDRLTRVVERLIERS